VSGHSKWANIKHKKGKADAQKGKLFTKLGRELIVAAKAGGGEPANNFRLKIAIDNAKAANMPNDNIQRAIQKGAGGGEGTNYEELLYEGYGPGGVAVMANLTEDELMLLVLEAGAEDLEEADGGYMVYTDPAGMASVRQALLDQGLTIEEADLNLVPENIIEIGDLEQAKKIVKLIDTLEEHDDVQKVYANFDIAEEIAQDL